MLEKRTFDIGLPVLTKTALARGTSFGDTMIVVISCPCSSEVEIDCGDVNPLDSPGSEYPCRWCDTVYELIQIPSGMIRAVPYKRLQDQIPSQEDAPDKKSDSDLLQGIDRSLEAILYILRCRR